MGYKCECNQLYLRGSLGPIGKVHGPVRQMCIRDRVKSIDMGKDYSSATADLAMDPRVEDMLLEGTEFWTVKPSISLALSLIHI